MSKGQKYSEGLSFYLVFTLGGGEGGGQSPSCPVTRKGDISHWLDSLKINQNRYDFNIALALSTSPVDLKA